MASSSSRQSGLKGTIDPTKPARYPVVLSPELLGKSGDEVLTGIRCE